MTNYELETIINFNEEEASAEIYTASSRVHKLLAARGLEPYKIDKMNGKPSGWYYSLSKVTVLLKPGNRVIRIGGKRRMPAIASSGTLGEPLERVSKNSKVIGNE